ncbi:uncharacterized protein LOC128546783 [Mercenaria mercenaria]|uniref:uncharacterized protein LOC128546783 n=1 Tax=Mercenaria mercenaria TaxID=6596 RepID=UPI00234F49D3|nr:uncharacterized protein LOC128546783 [Mercenaria mercenaria]
MKMNKIKWKKSEFWDDCGTWANGTSLSYTFLERDGKLVTIHKRQGLYCTEKVVDKQKVHEPLEPQPDSSELLILKRLYNTLNASEKGPDQFRRRCTWVINRPLSMPHLSLDNALVEYIGQFPGRKPHGNSIVNRDVYIRTKTNVRNNLKEELKHHSVKAVRNKMNIQTKDEHSKQRNEKQLRNIKHIQKKKTDKPSGNAADQIIHVEEMVKTHDMVYSVKHLKGLHHPVVTLLNEQQITDIKRFCGTGRTVLGVDKTYNLGDFHVTPTVFKDLSVIRQETQQHPITFGPTFIHTNSNAKTYSSFFHDIADNLTQEEINNLVIGSDEEKSFKIAIERCLPGATHTLCTRHLRQNTNRYLEDHVGYPKQERQQITSAIYGEDGLTFTGDMDAFQYKLERLNEKIETLDSKVGDKKFKPYFSDRLLPVLKSQVIEPCNKGKIERGWTNNNCESANHILKSATGWKQTDLPKFINLFNDIVKGENIERCRAICGRGDFRLHDTFTHHQTDIDKWSNMSEETRSNREKKFLSDKGRSHPNMVTSTNGNRTVLNTPNAGKKPNQTKRKRSERSRTPSAKRVLLA